MRRIALTVALLAGMAGAPAAATDTRSVVPRPCTPEGPLDIARPASCKRYTFRVPLFVTPGDNLILLGPVLIEKPAEDGVIVRFKPDLQRPDGVAPPIEVLHLHHAVWISSRFGEPLFATGEEKTIVSMPEGYGIAYDTNDVWVLNHMLHNQTAVSEAVFVTYDIDIIPTEAAGALKRVQPHWLDVADVNGFNPVYNTQRGYGAVPGECTFPKETCAAADPYGKPIVGNGMPGNGLGKTRRLPEGTIVWALGHLHPGGLRVEMDLVRGSQRRSVFVSDARYYDPNGPLSWDMSMEVTRPDYRLYVKSNDLLVLNSTYENARASWYEGMGIVIMYVAPGDRSGVDPFVTPFDPHNTDVTHGHMAEASNHGGGGQAPLEPPVPVETGSVVIAGFSYLPGALGQPLAPVVDRGEPLEFVNADVPAAIFHTVTSCAAPCNGATGISYPLANGPVDFDSLELGYGPPFATAAANTARYRLDTTPMAPGAYTYFCRVHPSMRGQFLVR